MFADRFLVDTNILLRLFVIRDRSSAECREAVARLRRNSVPLVFTLQNASEFWNTCTRPLERNGLAMAPADAAHALRVLLSQFSVVPETLAVFEQWMQLVASHEVRSVQVHDAKLVAVMKAHQIPAILTLNDAGFRRYDGIRVFRPEEIPA